VANGDVTGKPVHSRWRIEVVSDQPKGAVAMELFTVIDDDPGGLLAAVLQRMQTKRRVSGGIGMIVDTEHAALVVEVIIV